MIYKYGNTEHHEFKNSEEFRIYKTLEKTMCSICFKKKKKYVHEFAYFDKKKNTAKVYTLGNVCENCFELDVYFDCLRDFGHL